jgi:hypothetical protein
MVPKKPFKGRGSGGINAAAIAFFTWAMVTNYQEFKEMIAFRREGVN